MGGVARAVTSGRVRFVGTIAGRRIVTVATKLDGMDVVVTYTGLTSLDVKPGGDVGEGDRLGSGTLVHVGAYDAARRSRYLPVVAAPLMPAGGREDGLGGAIARRLQQAIDGTALPGNLRAGGLASGVRDAATAPDRSPSAGSGEPGARGTGPAAGRTSGAPARAVVRGARIDPPRTAVRVGRGGHLGAQQATIRRAAALQGRAVLAASARAGSSRPGARISTETAWPDGALPQRAADRPRHVSMVARRALTVLTRSIDPAPEQVGPARSGSSDAASAPSRAGPDDLTVRSTPIQGVIGTSGPRVSAVAAPSSMETDVLRRTRSDVDEVHAGLDARDVGLVLLPLALLWVMTVLARRRARRRRPDDGAVTVHRIPAPIVPSPRRHGRVVPRMPAEEWCDPHVPITGEVGLSDIDQPHEHPVRRRPREPA